MLRALLLVLVLVLLAPAGTHAATLRPASLAEIDLAIADEPRLAIERVGRELAQAKTASERFWALLGLARAQSMLERPAESAEALDRAEHELTGWAQARPAHRVWLELVRLQVLWPTWSPQTSRQRMNAVMQGLRTVGDDELACEAHLTDLALLIDANSLDEAWLAAESVEACSRELGRPIGQATALSAMGSIASRGHGRSQTETDVHFERAMYVLGDAPARITRSIVLWDRGNAMSAAHRWDEAARQYEAALALSRAIDDAAGIAAGNISLAETYIERHQPSHALPLLDEAQRLIAATDPTGYRLLGVARQRILALAQLGRAEVLTEIGRARRWDNDSQPAATRARLARAMARGYASQARFAEAYAETQRAESFDEQGRAYAADVQTLRLQARYAAAQRDAENAELRHRGEAARLELQAEAAKQRSLWAALALLGLAAAAALAFGWQAYRRRRVMTDLALRDELTGAPNRRAVVAYAQAQFEQAKRLGVPLTLALLDLDHFKRVNDTRGHAGGDAVLRALVGAAHGVLRGQDRLGRWGGEEWLLVMPGTACAEVPAVFERLRNRFAASPAEGIAGAHGVTFSMGAAELAPGTTSLDGLLAVCDRRLYCAKQSGRDRACCDG